jgi:hypothetical protein
VIECGSGVGIASVEGIDPTLKDFFGCFHVPRLGEIKDVV